ncbi:MAG TPA: tetratricopeptide repeat protein [Patescibacteria group bacterium]|nr:tetratricopeptide repeat protein [Patescibacteria group bacterium]
MPSPRPRFWPYLIVALVAVAVHLQTLWFPFVFDDEWLVAGNAFLREPWSALTAFAHHFWHGTPFGAGYYRPIVNSSFALNGRVLGWGPAGFHLVNVLLHAVNAMLVLRLLRRYSVGIGAATFGALLFAVHPAAAWPVGSIVARVDLLPALFILLAWGALAGGESWGTGLFFAAALLCKESAIAFLGVPFLALRTMRNGTARDATRRTVAIAAVACVAGLALALAARRLAGVPLAPPPSEIDPLINPLAGMPQPGRLLAALALSGRYLLYLFLPVRFTDPAAYGPGAAGPGPLSAGVIFGALLLLAWGLTVVLLWLRRDRLSLFLGFSLASFLPASNLIVPVASLYAQNFLYLPLLGLSLAAGDVAGRLLERLRVPRLPAAIAAVVLALLAAASVAEARVWSDATSLFTAWTERFPQYPLGWSRLGVARLGQGDAAGAEPLLREALRLYEPNAEGHYNLGLALLMTAGADQPQRLEEGIKESRRALELSPDLVQARVNASNALLLLGRSAEAEPEARAALAAAPGLRPARHILAEALFQQKRYADAAPLFRDLVAESPHDANLRSPLVVSLIDAGLLDEARTEAEAARREFPDMAWFDFCLARVEARSGHRQAALDLLGRAVERDPQTRDWIGKVPDFAGYPEPRPSAAGPSR